MSTNVIVADQPRYRLTDLGRLALGASETCECRWLLKDGWVFCVLCGTGLKTTRPQAARSDWKRGK